MWFRIVYKTLLNIHNRVQKFISQLNKKNNKRTDLNIGLLENNIANNTAKKVSVKMVLEIFLFSQIKNISCFLQWSIQKIKKI